MTGVRLAALASFGLAAPLLALQAPVAGPPAPGPLRAITLPPAQEVLLSNGLKLVVVEQHRQPIVSLSLSLPAGSAFDPEGKAGLADILAGLLTRGAGKRSGAEVASAIEDAGGSLRAGADPDFLTLQADFISSQAALGFELFGDAVLRPALDSADLAGLVARSAASLDAGLGDVGALAARVFLAATYQRHPYGRRPSPQSVQAIRRADLLAFLKTRARPAGSTLVVVGDLTLAEARRLATQWLGGWKGVRPVALPPPTPAAAPQGILLVHAGGVKEANIIIGTRTFAGADSGYYAAAVLAEILGGTRTGRFVRALGGDHAWAAATGASFLRTVRAGVFQASATVPVEIADSALAIMQAELARLRTDLVPARELERAREKVASAFAMRLQSAPQLVAAVTEPRLLGLPATYLATYRSRVMALTAAQIRAAARRFVPENGTVTVVVGDAARLYGPLSRNATVRIFAADGRPLSPEAIQPRDIALKINGSQVTSRIDSLAILAEGKTVGLQVTSLARSGDSLTYVENTVLGSVLSQTTTLVFDTTGRMRRLDQAGKVRGQTTRTQLAYRDGRVQGNANIVTTAGPKAVSVDTAVGSAIIDDNGVQAILALLSWELNTRWTFQVFAAGDNRVNTLTLTVADLSTVSVPAGTFECYRADLEGGPQRVSFYVTRAVPHRVVRMEIANSPIEFVAVNP